MLKLKGFEVEAFYFNPNIHPQDEYRKRKEQLENYAKELNIKGHIPIYDTADFFIKINSKRDTPLRCKLCWELRLEKTAKFAKENSFDAFTSTLLVSPYQNQELLKKTGEKYADEVGVKFYYEDFRPGYKESVTESKRKGMYRQKYCGCLYSQDRKQKSENRGQKSENRKQKTENRKQKSVKSPRSTYEVGHGV
jgi:predicted adenine nucleotide alpha hydrolase (AANH) superfamily ATPase